MIDAFKPFTEMEIKDKLKKSISFYHEQGGDISRDLLAEDLMTAWEYGLVTIDCDRERTDD